MTTKTRNLGDVLQEFSQHRRVMQDELQKVIVGQDEVIEQMFAAIFTRGHCLLEGVPGLAKTLMVSTLARILDLEFKRIQFTPDLMPSDITGTNVLEEDECVCVCVCVCVYMCVCVSVCVCVCVCVWFVSKSWISSKFIKLISMQCVLPLCIWHLVSIKCAPVELKA